MTASSWGYPTDTTTLCNGSEYFKNIVLSISTMFASCISGSKASSASETSIYRDELTYSLCNFIR